MANSNPSQENGGPNKKQRNQPLMEIPATNPNHNFSDPLLPVLSGWPNNPYYAPNHPIDFNFNPRPLQPVPNNYGHQFAPPQQPIPHVAPFNSRYKGSNYNPNFRRDNAGSTQTRPNLQQPSTKAPPAPPKVNFYAKLKQARKNVTCDGSDFLNEACVPVTDDWSKFMEPYFSLCAHRMLPIAAKSLKAAEKQAQGTQAPTLTEEEFNAKLEEVSNLHKT